MAENLPEDYCHQNLMKVFSAVGSVKTIRTCSPQTSNEMHECCQGDPSEGLREYLQGWIKFRQDRKACSECRLWLTLLDDVDPDSLLIGCL